MKRKFFAIILFCCMCLSIFSGCSLLSTKSDLTSDTVIAKIYDKEITYADLEKQYQTYSQYFAYYDQDIVMKIIYEEMYLNAIQEIEAEKVVVLSEDDMTEIFEDAFHEVLHLINSYEQTFIENDGKTAPSRITEHSDSEEDSKVYEDYVFEPAEPLSFDDVTPAAEPDFNQKLIELKDEMFKDVETEFMAYRTKAWNKFVSDLVYSYKLEGKKYSADEAVIETLKTLYDSYRTSKMSELYREYVESRVFGNMTYDEQIADAAMQKAIVDKYKELLFASKQDNTVEDNYTEIVFSTENTDLILYHYEGQYEFFTVKHILVEFSEDTLEILKGYEGYDAKKDEMFREEYLNARLDFAYDSSTGKWILETSYRDENGEVVQVEKTDEEGNIVYETNEDGSFVLDENGEKIPVMVDAKITVSEIMEKFEQECAQLFETERDKRREETSNPSYELTDEEKSYLRTNLFVQYVYTYTNDDSSLGSDALIEQIGYAISTDPDEDGGLMSEFADGGRTLYNNYKNNGYYIGEEILPVVTDYGVHLMMLSGVYKQGEIVSLQKADGTDKTDAEIIEELANTKIVAFSNKTLLNYVYDCLKEEELSSYYSTHLYEIFEAAKTENKFEVYREPTYNDLSGM